MKIYFKTNEDGLAIKGTWGLAFIIAVLGSISLLKPLFIIPFTLLLILAFFMDSMLVIE